MGVEYIKGLPTPPIKTGNDKVDLAALEDYLKLLYSALSRWNFTIPPTPGSTGDIDGGNPYSVYGGTENIDGGGVT